MWGQVILYFVYMGIPSRDNYDQKTSQTPSEETIIGCLCFKYFFFFLPPSEAMFTGGISQYLISTLLAFLPGKSQGQRSLVGYSQQGFKQLETTEHAHTFVWSDMCTTRRLAAESKRGY